MNMKYFFMAALFMLLFSAASFASVISENEHTFPQSNMHTEISRDYDGNLWAVIRVSATPRNSTIYKSSDNGTAWQEKGSFEWSCFYDQNSGASSFILGDRLYAITNAGYASAIESYNITSETLNEDCIVFSGAVPSAEIYSNKIVAFGRGGDGQVIATEFYGNLTLIDSYSSANIGYVSYPLISSSMKNDNSTVALVASGISGDSYYLEYYANNNTFSGTSQLDTQIGVIGVSFTRSLVAMPDNTLYLVASGCNFWELCGKKLAWSSDGITWNYMNMSSDFDSDTAPTIARYGNNPYAIFGTDGRLYLYNVTDGNVTIIAESEQKVAGHARGMNGYAPNSYEARTGYMEIIYDWENLTTEYISVSMPPAPLPPVPTPPIVTILFPEEITYYVSGISVNVSVNYTAEDDFLDSCWYRLNNASETPIPSCSNITILVENNVCHDIAVYANDTEATQSSDNVVFCLQSPPATPTGRVTGATASIYVVIPVLLGILIMLYALNEMMKGGMDVKEGAVMILVGIILIIVTAGIVTVFV